GPYIYDPYGNCFSGGSACSSSGEPYRFTGRRWDAEIGCYYYRARYYCPGDARGGRFALQTDPVGYQADLNLYTYVGNDPADEADATGMSVEANTCSRVGASDCSGSYAGDKAIFDKSRQAASTNKKSTNQQAQTIFVEPPVILEDPIITENPEVIGSPEGMTPLEELPPGEAEGPGAGQNFPKELGKPKPDEEMPNCAYCRQKTTKEPGPRQLHRDHIIPKKEGGTNTPRNMTPSCRTC